MNEPMFRLDQEGGAPRRRFANPDSAMADGAVNAAKPPASAPIPAPLGSAVTAS